MCIIKSIRTQVYTHTPTKNSLCCLQKEMKRQIKDIQLQREKEREVKRQRALTVFCSATEVITEQKERERKREKKDPSRADESHS